MKNKGIRVFCQLNEKNIFKNVPLAVVKMKSGSMKVVNM